MFLSGQMQRQGAWLFKHRGVLPIFILLIGAYLFLRTEQHDGSHEIQDSTIEMACLVISMIGFAIRVYTVGYSAPNTSGRNTREQVADVLNTKGIYSIVRNPLYLGNFFMWLGLALLSFNFWFIISFIIFYILYYERIIYTEEEFLKTKFPEDFKTWAEKTPVIIPTFKRFVKNDYPFNWKKVIWQEKTGLLWLFLIYTAFNIGGNLIQGKSNFNWILIAGTILSLLFYITLKILSKHFIVSDNKGMAVK